MDALEWVLAVGVGATLLMDLWALAQRRFLAVPTLDYALVGRWLAHIPQGRFRHDHIAVAAPAPGERAIGWLAHYAIGVAFAGLLLAIGGNGWASEPTPGLALAVGAATVAAPFAIMQPALGFGFAASRLPRPWNARARSLVTHLVFGAGLYLAAAALAASR